MRPHCGGVFHLQVSSIGQGHADYFGQDASELPAQKLKDLVSTG
ncbi:MAG: hypothetical protein ACLFS1_00045 [Opitutales bacterium]